MAFGKILILTMGALDGVFGSWEICEIGQQIKCEGGYLDPKREKEYLLVIFWKMWTSTWKKLIFTHYFLKNVNLNMKNVDLYTWFYKEFGPRTEKCGPYSWFYEKCEPQPEKCGLLHVILWRIWTSKLGHYEWFSGKCGPRTENSGRLRMIFNMKNVDINLKKGDLYVWFCKNLVPQPEKCVPFIWFSEKNGTQLEKCEPWHAIFPKYVDHNLKLLTFTCDVLKKVALILKNVALNLKNVDLCVRFSE